MVMGVLNQAFDVLVLRFGVQKRIYCNVSVPGVRGRRAPTAKPSPKGLSILFTLPCPACV